MEMSTMNVQRKGATFNLRTGASLSFMFSPNMKVSGIIVLSVIIKPTIGIVSTYMFSPNMKGSSTSARSVDISLQQSSMLRDMWTQSTWDSGIRATFARNNTEIWDHFGIT